ncbi:MAG TPA: phosphatase PAP2 family protein [Candidatus Saccharimonadales bacterium]|nr:phosphatase PAP2 family protein [Candidatus Saccharimonadales bacterium]
MADIPKVSKTNTNLEIINEEAGAAANQSRKITAYLIAFLLALSALLASTYLAHKQIMGPGEVKVFRHINNMPDSLKILGKATSIAKNSTWIAVVAVVLAFAWRKWRLAWQMAGSILAGYVVTFGLKHFIHRPRPAELLTGVHLRWSDTGAGFPSGHVMVVTVILLTLMPYLPKMWRWIVPVAGIGVVAWSRMYLGLHAPLDIVGGFAVGVGVVTFIHILPAKVSHFLRLNDVV